MRSFVRPIMIGIGALAVTALTASLQAQPRSQGDVITDAQVVMHGTAAEAKRDTKDMLGAQKKAQAEKKQARAAAETQRGTASGAAMASATQQKVPTGAPAASLRQPVPMQAPRAYK